MRNSFEKSSMRKEYNQIRKIDYTVRDLSHLDQGSGVKKSGGCLIKLIILSIMISFFAAAFMFFTKNSPFTGQKYAYRYNKGIERVIKTKASDNIKHRLNKNYYMLSISLESNSRGKITYQELIYLKFLQRLIKDKLSLKTISLVDYVERTFAVLKKTEKKSFFKGSRADIIQKIIFILESSDLKMEGFFEKRYSRYNIYIEKDGKRSLDSIKASVLEIVKSYSKERKLTLTVDFSKGPGAVIPVNKIRADSGSIVIDR